jgi:hypothetical protein
MPSPEWIWGIAIVVLAVAVAYGVLRSRQRSASERATTERATREGYRAQDLQDKARPMPE